MISAPPLVGIIGFSQLIQVENKDPKISKYAEDLVASGHALLKYLNEILETIRVVSGEVPLLNQKFDLQTNLQTVIDLMRATAGAKKLDLHFSYDEKLPRYVISDPKRIHRIVLELVSNALTFTETGFVRLSAIAESVEKNNFILRLVVEDSGIGIPEEKQAEIFTRFKKLIPSYKGIHKGLGLGLSIVKEYMNDLEGEIYVDGSVKKGAKLTCLIPLKIALLQTDEGSTNSSSI